MSSGGLEKDSYDSDSYDINFVFEPDLLDRTDWYTYDSDNYGATDYRFQQRLSPNELMESEKKYYQSGNEQMFRTGIPMDKVKALTCSNTDQVIRVVEILQQSGITEINGRPIEQVVSFAPKLKDFVKISSGEQTGGKTTAQILIENNATRLLSKEALAREIPKIIQNISHSLNEATGALSQLDTALQGQNFDKVLDKVKTIVDSVAPGMEQIQIQPLLAVLSQEQKNELLEATEKNFAQAAGLLEKLQQESTFSAFENNLDNYGYSGYGCRSHINSLENLYRVNIAILKEGTDSGTVSTPNKETVLPPLHPPTPSWQNGDVPPPPSDIHVVP